MAGHSKWANIKHKKAKEDAKRGKVFTKLIKEITVAARAGGGDPASNAKLRQLMEKAKHANMPQDNVTRAIKKGTGELPGVTYEHALYEGYGPGGIGIIVEILTDNKNRAVADLRHIFSKHGGNLAESGAVNWMFANLGVVRATAPENMTEDQILEALIDHDIKDVTIHDGLLSVTCAHDALNDVKHAVENLGIKVDDAELEWVAQNTTKLDEEQEQKAFVILEKLEEHDDVQHVFTNLQ